MGTRASHDVALWIRFPLLGRPAHRADAPRHARHAVAPSLGGRDGGTRGTVERSHGARGVFVAMSDCEPVSGAFSCSCARFPFLAIVRSLEGSGRLVLNHGDCDSVLRLRLFTVALGFGGDPLSNRGLKSTVTLLVDLK